MIAIDTNVLVRIVTNDEPEQARRAAEVLQQDAVFIAKTVILELEWVLRYCYELERSVIEGALQKILATDNFTIEHNTAVSQALLWYGQGMDFADALHLSSNLLVNQFASFDRKLINKAAELDTRVVVFGP